MAKSVDFDSSNRPVVVVGNASTAQGCLEEKKVSVVNPEKKTFLSPKAKKILSIVLLMISIACTVIPYVGQIGAIAALIGIGELPRIATICLGITSLVAWWMSDHLAKSAKKAELAMIATWQPRPRSKSFDKQTDKLETGMVVKPLQRVKSWPKFEHSHGITNSHRPSEI